ncbi:hypothetical protein J6590_068459 [Homalodisca vitripennis]|nr:hypothetical protein J6590_068459 [Homalodisca vitripennis]
MKHFDNRIPALYLTLQAAISSAALCIPFTLPPPSLQHPFPFRFVDVKTCSSWDINLTLLDDFEETNQYRIRWVRIPAISDIARDGANVMVPITLSHHVVAAFVHRTMPSAAAAAVTDYATLARLIQTAVIATVQGNLLGLTPSSTGSPSSLQSLSTDLVCCLFHGIITKAFRNVSAMSFTTSNVPLMIVICKWDVFIKNT